jgi:GGDEF domain-containing protein
MNYLWKKEADNNGDLQSRLDHLERLLKSSELRHLTDPITGVPNIQSLQNDFESYVVNTDQDRPKVQFVFIDLKEFGKINKDFHSRKGSKLIRQIAQSIYLGMRRNESMFKFPATEEKPKSNKGSFYRIFPGGDEFVFIIEGDQSDAVGFVNRLRDQFVELSKLTPSILGQHRDLSFYCAIVQMDTFDKSLQDILERAEICYRSVWSTATANFAIAWYPENMETILSKVDRKKKHYVRAKELFEVVSIAEHG